MSGRSKQDKMKAQQRAAFMGATDEELRAADRWQRPPANELADDPPTTIPVAGEPIDKVMMKIRIVRCQTTWRIAVFSIVLLTLHRGKWCEVAEIDSCHDTDFHLHQNGKSTNGRVSDPVTLGPISSIEDVDAAYGVALAKMEDEYRTLLDRWHHG